MQPETPRIGSLKSTIWLVFVDAVNEALGRSKCDRLCILTTHEPEESLSTLYIIKLTARSRAPLAVSFITEVLALTYKVKTMADVVSLPCKLPQAVRDELIRAAAVLDYEYGENRDDADGGYSLIVQSLDDLAEAKSFVDFEHHPPEWVNRFDSYAAALYVLTNDLTVTLFVPLDIAPESIAKEMNEP